MYTYQNYGTLLSFQAKTAYESGRYSEAEAHGRKARKQVWIAIVIGTIATVIALAIMAVIVYLKVPNSVS